MNDNIKSTSVEQKILRKGDSDSYWYDIINDYIYSPQDMIHLLKSGWKIVNFNDAYTGTQSYTHGRITILLEKY